MSSARHLDRGAPGEGHQQQTMGVGAIQDQMRDPMGESLGLTGTRTGRDQQPEATLFRRRCRLRQRCAAPVQVAQMPAAID